MAVDLSIEDRYVQHQRGLFVTNIPRVPSVGYVSCAWPPHYQARAPERPDQNLHVVVDKLQKQVNELQLLVRSLQSQAVKPQEAPVAAAPVSPSPDALARTPSEEALLRLHRERREQCNERAERAQRDRTEERIQEVPRVREPSERRQVKRAWIQGLSKGPSLWQVLQQLLCEQKETKRAPNDEAQNMSVEELSKYVRSDLQERYGLVEVAAVHAALSMHMCSEQEIDTYLATEGEKGLRLAPLAAAAALPKVAFGAQGFEDALLDVLQVRVSRKNARRLFRHLASGPKSAAPIGSSGTTAQLSQLSGHSKSEAISERRASPKATPGLRRSRSEGRSPGTAVARPEAQKRLSTGVHLQEEIRQRWQRGLRDESPEGAPESKLSSRRPSLKSSAPPKASPPVPPPVNRRSYEVWRRDVSLKSLLAFEAEVKARQESSTTSSDNDAPRELPGSSRSSKLPSSDSPPSSLRLRRSSEEERLEALPARLRGLQAQQSQAK